MQKREPVHFYRCPIEDKQLNRNQHIQLNKAVHMKEWNYRNNDSLINQHNC